MPKYSNSTTADIVIDNIRIPAKESVETSTFFTGTLPTGITIDSIYPQINSVLYANKFSVVTGGVIPTITVPDSTTKGYDINFYVESGEFSIKLNTSVMSPVIVVTEGQTWKNKYVNKTVNTIDISCVIGGQIYITIIEH